MTEENIEVVQRSYRLLEGLRAAKPYALAHAFRGREGLKRWVASTREIWEEWRFEPERFLDAGDQVVARVRVVTRGGSSGVSLDRETAHLWTLRDGRVTRCEVYLDRSEALDAVGLREQHGHR